MLVLRMMISKGNFAHVGNVREENYGIVQLALNQVLQYFPRQLDCLVHTRFFRVDLMNTYFEIIFIRDLPHT